MKIVIIEDEKLTAEDLKETLEGISPEIHIMAMLHSVAEAKVWFANDHFPDLIFSDIQLNDGLCFDIFSSVEINAPVIFCTAFDEYAISAFKSNGIDYILKPFDSTSIKKSIEKYQQLKSILGKENDLLKKAMHLFASNQKPAHQSILVNQKDKIVPVRFEDIALIYIECETLFLITFDQKKYAHYGTMEEMEEKAGYNFFRVNRQFLVNRQAIKEASRYFERKLSLNLKINFSEPITVSKNKVTSFLQWLEGV